MITSKEIFNKVATHMLTQNAKSQTLDADGIELICAYRGNDGRMCAVGCLIKDEAYNSMMEGYTINLQTTSRIVNEQDVMIRSALVESDIPTDRDTLILLQRLQSIHDMYEVKDWVTKLNDLARQYGFEPV